jgi:hypothetical protein
VVAVPLSLAHLTDAVSGHKGQRFRSTTHGVGTDVDDAVALGAVDPTQSLGDTRQLVRRFPLPHRTAQ